MHLMAPFFDSELQKFSSRLESQTIRFSLTLRQFLNVNFRAQVNILFV